MIKSIEVKAIENEIESAIIEQQLKRADLGLLNFFDNFELDDDNKYLMGVILELYFDYVRKLKDLEEYFEPFLITIRNIAIVNNQSIEAVSAFLSEMYLNSDKNSGTLYSQQNKLTMPFCTVESFVDIHAYLMDGISSKYQLNGHYRTDNTTFVGETINGVRKIDYIPIDFREIPTAIDYILKSYNNRSFQDESEILLRPIINQALISAFQSFSDGNTRLSRIIRNTQTWDLTRQVSDFRNLPMPAVYVEEAINTFNKGALFRKMISEMVKNPSSELINKWIEENLIIFEKQIYINQRNYESSLNALQRIRKGKS